MSRKYEDFPKTDRALPQLPVGQTFYTAPGSFGAPDDGGHVGKKSSSGSFGGMITEIVKGVFSRGGGGGGGVSQPGVNGGRMGGLPKMGHQPER